jgi:penicillin G amidase
MRRALFLACVLVLLVSGSALAAPRDRGEGGRARLPFGGTVIRDRDGIVHISAGSDYGLFYAQGWAHARDRLFQMDFRRRQASGTLAELLGEGALPSDVQMRTVGLRRAAERSLPLLSQRARTGLQAYADGVNAWVRGHQLPPEYAALELGRFPPWSATDSIVIGKLIAFGLSFDLTELDLTPTLLAYVQAGVAGGFDGAKLFSEDLFRSQPFSDASTVPDATGRGPRSAAARADDLGTPPDAAAAPGPEGAGDATAGGPERAEPGPAADGQAADSSRSGAASRLAAAMTAPATIERLQAAARLASRYTERAREAPLIAQALDASKAQGSNEWGVAARHSTTGAPLIANDPHLGLDAPSTFYPNHLRLTRGGRGGMNVTGETFAGTPGVILGHNADISWGATTNPADVTDVYLERVTFDASSPSGLATVHQGRNEAILPIVEVYRQNNPGNGKRDDLALVPPSAQVPPVTLIVPRRNNGPLLELDLAEGTALSVQYTGFSGTRELDTFLTWSRAEDLGDFRKGLETFDVGSQNWAYADRDGNLAYFTSAEIPIREDLQAGTVRGLPPFLVRDGTGGNEWLGVQRRQPGQAVPYEVLPASEMPHVVNPPAGFFVNANNDPAGTTLDNDPLNQLRPGGGIYYLNPGYDGIRGGRVTELLRARLARGKVSRADLEAIQADVGLLDAEFFVPYINRAMDAARRSGNPALRQLAQDPALAEAAGRLRGWDLTTPTGIQQGYDAADVDGKLRPPSGREVASSVAATIYAVWRSELIRAVIDSRLAMLGNLPRPDDDRALAAIRNLLEQYGTRGGSGASGVNFFDVPGVSDPAERRDLVLLRALATALERLAGPEFAPAFNRSSDQDDYRWGKLHRLIIDHPLGGRFNVPPAGGAFPQPLPGLPGIPTDGAFGVVDASYHNARADTASEFTYGSGPARRYVVSAGRHGMTAESSLPGGVSGVPGNDFYLNLLRGYLTNDTYRVLSLNWQPSR